MQYSQITIVDKPKNISISAEKIRCGSENGWVNVHINS